MLQTAIRSYQSSISSVVYGYGRTPGTLCTISKTYSDHSNQPTSKKCEIKITGSMNNVIAEVKDCGNCCLLSLAIASCGDTCN